MRERRTTVVGTAVLACGLLAATGPAEPAPGGGRDVVFVANAEDGTVTAVDAETFEVLHQLDVVPDGDTAEPGEDDPFQALLGQQLVEAAGGENLAQDQDLSPDGRTLYVSRGHRGDVAAFDLATGELLWKSPVDGIRADHATLSADGTRLYVSSLTTDVVEVFDTADGTIVGSAATGEWPHDNHLSADGARLYNASIGNIVTPWEAREARAELPGVPSPYQLRIIDTATLETLETFEFDRGIRPFALNDDETRMYAQLSELHGVIEYDLEAGEERRRLELPIDDGVTEDDYSFEAPHHGLALSADGGTLCLAGRASDYVALVDVATFEATAIVDVGDMPSWALTTPDGEHCVAANTGSGTVSFV
ncbi:MAG: PQQ-binding-like beta-propeller repeat protein, partial [Actinobacteria bacterium]|nr:PQQ-binding-like beta-propeller repeat protein [Actinomycetota bacterium]